MLLSAPERSVPELVEAFTTERRKERTVERPKKEPDVPQRRIKLLKRVLQVRHDDAQPYRKRV